MERAAENGARHVAVETPHACEGGREERQRFVEPTRAAALAVYELLAELGDGRCRWPLNVTSPIDAFKFCGRPVFRGSYCEACFRLSCRGVEPKADAAWLKSVRNSLPLSPRQVEGKPLNGSPPSPTTCAS